jgi:hypothetical protein
VEEWTYELQTSDRVEDVRGRPAHDDHLWLGASVSDLRGP